MNRLSLFVPDLPAALAHAHANTTPLTRWPALSLLLARAELSAHDEVASECHLLGLCGVDANGAPPISAASLTAQVDGLESAGAPLLRADPVHLRADPHQILLFRDLALMPSATEADALIDALNAGVADARFERGSNPARWYCRYDAGYAGTCAPRMVAGRSIGGRMPPGDAGVRLRQLMNETQMILHDTAVNRARDARGIAPINGVWLWNADPAGALLQAPPQCLVGDDVLLAGIARHTGIAWRASEGAGDLFAGGRTPDHVLAVYGAPHGAYTNPATAFSLDALESDWLRPVLRALRRLRLHHFELITSSATHRVRPRHLLRWWRRPVREIPDGAP